MPSTFTDNFGNEYMQPYIPNKIVGFIGLDPDIVSSGGGEVGNRDHEQLDNLFGGDDENGHWHLTDGEYQRLQEMLLDNAVVPAIRHEALPDLLGGDRMGGHWHIGEKEWALINGLHNAVDKGVVPSEGKIRSFFQLIATYIANQQTTSEQQQTTNNQNSNGENDDSSNDDNSTNDGTQINDDGTISEQNTITNNGLSGNEPQDGNG